MVKRELIYLCDNMRHLICVPYSVKNLHRMAEHLGIKRCWFHNSKYPHYDIPKRRITEITAKCRLVSPTVIAQIVRGDEKKSLEAQDAFKIEINSKDENRLQEETRTLKDWEEN